jgi:DNA-directed RNA polymerase II subunit RPB2
LFNQMSIKPIMVAPTALMETLGKFKVQAEAEFAEAAGAAGVAGAAGTMAGDAHGAVGKEVAGLTDAIWDVIFAYFQQGGGTDATNVLVQHQIDNYNEFIDKKLYQIINGFNPIQICHQFHPELRDFVYKIFIKIQNPCLSKPMFQTQDGTQLPMTPHIARMNNLSYASQLTVDVVISTETINEDQVIEKKETTVPKVNIGKIPIMVRSKICLLNQLPSLGEGEGRHECRYDPGGYFIINGNEKVAVCQDRISENKTLVFAPNVSSSDGLTAEIRSMPDGIFLPPKICSIHLNNKPNHMGRLIRLNATFLRSEIPLFVMFRALGVISDREILQHIVLDLDDPKNQRLIQELKACADDAADITNQADALAMIQRVMSMSGFPREYMDQPEVVLRHVHQTLRADFLSHTGTHYRRKALYLGYMVRKLLKCYLGYLPFDNRDSYIYKRIDTPGILMSILFRQCYGKLMKEARNLIQRELHLWRAATKLDLSQIIHQSNIHRFLKPNIIESCYRYALSTGNWIVKTLGSYQNNRQGVAQVLNRMAYLSMLSHLRRINTPMEKNGKLVQPRKLENTQYGMICPAETPEGGSVGLVKNMALSTRITTNSSSAYIRTMLPELGVRVYEDSEPGTGSGTGAGAEYMRQLANKDCVLVQVNGDLVGFHAEPATFYRRMKRMKRLGEISPFTAVYWDVPENTIVINTEAGRMCRPLLIVDDDGELRLAKRLRGMSPEEWRAFVAQPFHTFIVGTRPDADEEGFIEYMDVEEIDKHMVAMFPKDLHAPVVGASTGRQRPNYTHCELHPSLMNGVLGVNIPFSDHNQSPRNAYQCAMGKQAVGIYMSNYNQRIDTIGHILNYAQKPLARTKLSKITHSENLPSGVNAVVAIMTYTGFNQEDSVMINQSALDRGLFSSTYYKSYKDQCNKNHSTGEEEVFTRPDAKTTAHMKPFHYGKLGEDGFVPKNTAVDHNDIIVGKIMPQKIQGVIYPKDASLYMKANDTGHIDLNYQGVNADGYRFCKVRLRKYRKPTVGDKVSSRHGQKGTIGMVYRQQDMPFSKEGIVPDIIINPHAIPSRMTIGQMMECIMGKACCQLGTMGDATPFNGATVEDLAEVLESYGMERYGNEVLYDGRTGVQITTEIFMGPTFYQRLKHMVEDKMHTRGGNGPVVMLTRQPAEGRARNGGLRFGEMERDAIVAHGASAFLKERMLDVSDNYRVFVCRKCGMLCVANPEKNIYKCTHCKNSADITQARIPYSMKLLLQELMTMAIAPRIVI